jgi:hypothetical protein
LTVFTFNFLGGAEALFNGVDAGFNGANPSGHQGLWETNGTAAGTHEFDSGINPTNFAVVRGASLFSLPEVAQISPSCG